MASARADEARCAGTASAFEPNGAKLANLESGANRTLEILAIGSSSTEGIGASSPANAYPARLKDELTHDDGIAADVRNAGVGGELAVKTLQRLKAALKTGWAELVIWQVGTNDALVGVDEAPDTLRRASAVHPIAAVQSEYSLWTRNPELGLVQACAEARAILVAFSPVDGAISAAFSRRSTRSTRRISVMPIRAFRGSTGGATATASCPIWRSPDRGA